MTKQQIWLLSTVSPEDLAKIEILSETEITEALKKGSEDRLEAERYYRSWIL